RLLPWRKAWRNVELVLDSGTRAERRDRAHRWLARVGLADAADVYPTAPSGGMRQRVATGRALARGAPSVLVGAPSSHLDRVTAEALRHELCTNGRAAGSAVIWVTHDPDEALAVADRTLVMAGPPSGAWSIVD